MSVDKKTFPILCNPKIVRYFMTNVSNLSAVRSQDSSVHKRKVVYNTLKNSFALLYSSNYAW